MKILYYDCFSGISGDMNLGAMIDLGVDKNYLIGELSKLNIDGYVIEVTSDSRKGIMGTRVDVILKQHSHEENEGHEHRNFEDIKKIIDSSSLNKKVKEISLNIFRRVAEAEAKVHGKPLSDVHFHEVGAVDSIVDIVGAAICFNYFNVDMVISSPVETGSGFVRCAHGMLPVPAPATAEILKGIPLKVKEIPFEATTPTGAAIITEFASEFTDKKDFKIIRIGYGIGHKDEGNIPNVLRIFLAEKNEILNESRDTIKEHAFMIECNIDDMNPENYDYIMEKLFMNRIMDAYLTPVIMKKGRPAVKISVLCSGKAVEKIEEILLSETSTLGVRRYEVEKDMLRRENSTVNTAYGNIRVKKSYLKGERIKFKPEYDDCKRVAVEKGIPLVKVYEEVMREMDKEF